MSAFQSQSSDDEKPSDDLVTTFVDKRLSGEVSAILSAPHGGRAEFENQSTIFRERYGTGISTKGDLLTCELLGEISARFHMKSGRVPHVIKARVHRKYIDFNRDILNPRDVAVAQDDLGSARSVYEGYHEGINDAVRNCISSSPSSRCLLLDIHGHAQAEHDDSIVVGIGACRRTCDEDLMKSPGGFLWHLRKLAGAQGIKIKIGHEEVPSLSGGYSVQRHGRGRVDALQLEFSRSMRLVPGKRVNVAELVAEAMHRHIYASLSQFISRPEFGCSPSEQESIISKLGLINCFSLNDVLKRGVERISADLSSLGIEPFTSEALQRMLSLEDTSTNLPPLPVFDKTKLPYCSCYCEENIYLLARQALQDFPAYGEKCFVVFVTSVAKRTPVWCQRSSSRRDGQVCWDYHVFLLFHGNIKLIFDFDTTLDFPCNTSSYIQQAFRPSVSCVQLKPECRQMFRVVSARTFVDVFASDRSHMLESTTAPPTWSMIRGSAADSDMNLLKFLDVSLTGQDCHGMVFSLEEFIEWSRN